MYLAFLLKHNIFFEYVQQETEEEGLEEAPGILENVWMCVIFDGNLMGELSGSVNLTAHALRENLLFVYNLHVIK